MLASSCVGIAATPAVFLVMMDRTLEMVASSGSSAALVLLPGLVFGASVVWMTVFIRAVRFHWRRLRRSARSCNRMRPAGQPDNQAQGAGRTANGSARRAAA